MVRLLIMAGDPYVREGLAALLESEGEIEVCGQIDPAEYLRGRIEIYAPDLVLVDGQDATADNAHLRSALSASEWPVIILDPDDGSAEWGWPPDASVLPRRADLRQLRAAIHAVDAGLLVLDRKLDLAKPTLAEPPLNEVFAPLTDRELEVLHRLAEGLTNKAIAQALGISENTVKFHMNSLFQKMNVQSRTEAVVHAIRAGLLPL